MQITSKSLKLIIVITIALIVVVAIAISKTPTQIISYENYDKLLKRDSILKIIIQGENSWIITKQDKYTLASKFIDFKKLKKVNVEIKQEINGMLITTIVIALIFVYLFYKNLNVHLGKAEDENEIETTKVKFEDKTSSSIKPVKSKIMFRDVAGITEAKEELSEIVDFLKEPKKYTDLGVRLPKGLILMGSPGVGKTLIAKAVAGEAGVPFFYESGSSFVQIYVGMGPKKVRELFAKAKEFSPSIIFIDEIDAVGKKRDGSRNEEREATLNQLLTEMDGFEDNSGVFVIAATNKIEVLDDALLRAGRFDRRVYVSLPDLQEREEILSLYLKDKKHSVNIKEVAKLTASFSGAAIATLVNEAALHAIKQNKEKIDTNDMLNVKEKVTVGKKKIVMLSPKEREIQALYQSAKALCAYWLEVDFEKISLLSSTFKKDDKEIVSKTDFLSQIKVLLAGSVATKLVYNEEFSNAKEDKQAVNQLLIEMEEIFGIQSEKNIELLKINDNKLQHLFSKFIDTLTSIKEIMLSKEYVTKVEIEEIVG